MKEEIQNWQEAQEILANHDCPSVETARELIQGQDQFLEEMHKKIIIWDPSNYKVLPKETSKQAKTINVEVDNEEVKVIEEDPTQENQQLDYDRESLNELKASAYQVRTNDLEFNETRKDAQTIHIKAGTLEK
jgi:hypothetical protein